MASCGDCWWSAKHFPFTGSASSMAELLITSAFPEVHIKLAATIISALYTDLDLDLIQYAWSAAKPWRRAIHSVRVERPGLLNESCLKEHAVASWLFQSAEHDLDALEMAVHLTFVDVDLSFLKLLLKNPELAVEYLKSSKESREMDNDSARMIEMCAGIYIQLVEEEAVPRMVKLAEEALYSLDEQASRAIVSALRREQVEVPPPLSFFERIEPVKEPVVVVEKRQELVHRRRSSRWRQLLMFGGLILHWRKQDDLKFGRKRYQSIGG